MIKIPNFNDDRINFVKFIQKNRDIFDDLLLSGKYYLTRGLNNEYIIEGYNFLIDFDLGDDADEYDLIYNLDDQTDINKIINEFQKWLKTDKAKTYFKKKFNANKLLPQLNEKIEKRRTMKRTLEIKDELGLIGLVPDDRMKSIKGKEYRSLKNEFEKKKTRGGNKTKKNRCKNIMYKNN
jgi:hypothetical protein